VVSRLTPLITRALAAGLYSAAYKLSSPPVMDGQKDLTPEEHTELLAAAPPPQPPDTPKACPACFPQTGNHARQASMGGTLLQNPD
jgi:hypothetical protein